MIQVHLQCGMSRRLLHPLEPFLHNDNFVAGEGVAFDKCEVGFTVGFVGKTKGNWTLRDRGKGSKCVRKDRRRTTRCSEVVAGS